MKYVLAVLLAAGLALNGWIGYRATERPAGTPQHVCYEIDRPNRIGIMCMNPETGQDSFRVVYLADDGRARTLP